MYCSCRRTEFGFQDSRQVARTHLQLQLQGSSETLFMPRWEILLRGQAKLLVSPSEISGNPQGTAGHCGAEFFSLLPTDADTGTLKFLLFKLKRIFLLSASLRYLSLTQRDF